MQPILCEETLRSLGHDVGEEMLPALFEIFISENQPKIEQLAELDAQTDLASMQIYYHTIKSSAATYGALRLAELATHLDKACKDNNTTELTERQRQFMQLLASTLEVMANRYSSF